MMLLVVIERFDTRYAIRYALLVHAQIVFASLFGVALAVVLPTGRNSLCIFWVLSVRSAIDKLVTRESEGARFRSSYVVFNK